MMNISPKRIIRIDKEEYLDPILKMLDDSGYKWISGVSLLRYKPSLCKYLFVHEDYTVTYNNTISYTEEYEYFTSTEMLDEIEHHVCATSDLKIEKVIFNEPATIIIWNDGTKTVVKCQEGDEYDKEKGFAICITKKFFGNKSKFNNVMKEWVK